eukprot:403349380
MKNHNIPKKWKNVDNFSFNIKNEGSHISQTSLLDHNHVLNFTFNNKILSINHPTHTQQFENYNEISQGNMQQIKLPGNQDQDVQSQYQDQHQNQKSFTKNQLNFQERNDENRVSAENNVFCRFDSFPQFGSQSQSPLRNIQQEAIGITNANSRDVSHIFNQKSKIDLNRFIQSRKQSFINSRNDIKILDDIEEIEHSSSYQDQRIQSLHNNQRHIEDNCSCIKCYQDPQNQSQNQDFSELDPKIAFSSQNLNEYKCQNFNQTPKQSKPRHSSSPYQILDNSKSIRMNFKNICLDEENQSQSFTMKVNKYGKQSNSQNYKKDGSQSTSKNVKNDLNNQVELTNDFILSNNRISKAVQLLEESESQIYEQQILKQLSPLNQDDNEFYTCRASQNMIVEPEYFSLSQDLSNQCHLLQQAQNITKQGKKVAPATEQFNSEVQSSGDL